MFYAEKDVIAVLLNLIQAGSDTARKNLGLNLNLAACI